MGIAGLFLTLTLGAQFVGIRAHPIGAPKYRPALGAAVLEFGVILGVFVGFAHVVSPLTPAHPAQIYDGLEAPYKLSRNSTRFQVWTQLVLIKEPLHTHVPVP